MNLITSKMLFSVNNNKKTKYYQFILQMTLSSPFWPLRFPMIQILGLATTEFVTGVFYVESGT